MTDDLIREPGANGWERVTDPSDGAVYFFNVDTGDTQWDMPPDFGGAPGDFGAPAAPPIPPPFPGGGDFEAPPFGGGGFDDDFGTSGGFDESGWGNDAGADDGPPFGGPPDDGGFAPPVPAPASGLAAGLDVHSWWDGSATRASAEAYLSGSPSGSFIVRPSSQAGCLSLSVKNGQSFSVDHLILKQYPVGWSAQIQQKWVSPAKTLPLLLQKLQPYINYVD
eukprot:CAMPEP_0170750556 /NCGR_PEP_ID=MMETSP0437-20130122/10991_1 /TAXON_ID=0 /ORGANISM="Sexangularia sp." /LENGTH=221 /DNA_ID=CAMNT_0011089553 /DNA_START=114 /DNA_END=779 /DNA_ORIENTATION=-